MIQGNMFGRVESKKTINVEANLLAERLAGRQRIIRRAQQKLALIGLASLGAALTVPGLADLRSGTAAVAIRERAAVQKLAAQMRDIKAAHEASVPKLAERAMAQRLRAQAKAYLGQLTFVLNTVPPSVAVSSVKSEVMGGAATLTCQAEAESFEAMREFVGKASGGPRVESAVLVSSRKSDQLASGGVSFDYVKKVVVKP